LEFLPPYLICHRTAGRNSYLKIYPCSFPTGSILQQICLNQEKKGSHKNILYLVSRRRIPNKLQNGWAPSPHRLPASQIEESEESSWSDVTDEENILEDDPPFSSTQPRLSLSTSKGKGKAFVVSDDELEVEETDEDIEEIAPPRSYQTRTKTRTASLAAATSLASLNISEHTATIRAHTPENISVSTSLPVTPSASPAELVPTPIATPPGPLTGSFFASDVTKSILDGWGPQTQWNLDK